MKVKINGISGEILNMDSMVSGGRNKAGEPLMKIQCYCVTIMESPGRDVKFTGIRPDEIEYLGV